MTIIEAKNYNSRSDLENYVRNKFGLTPDYKEKLVIQGTEYELKRLFLGSETVFWGIRCEITDKIIGNPKVGKPMRYNRKDTSIDYL